jgi:hypothetical protein
MMASCRIASGEIRTRIADIVTTRTRRDESRTLAVQVHTGQVARAIDHSKSIPWLAVVNDE